MNKTEYLGLADVILTDSNTYTELRRDPTCTFQRKSNKKIAELKQDKFIDSNQAKSLTIYKSVAPKFYGLPKIHKPTLSLRPIISYIDSPNNKLAAFIMQILTESYTFNKPYYIRDSFEFSEFIN